MKNDRREIFGWLCYDWANHSFFTLVLGVLIGEYLTSLAQRSVGDNGAILSFGGYGLVTAKSLYSYSVGISVFLQVFFLPTLGAIADYTHLKKTFLAVFCYLGAFACALLVFAGEGHYLFGALLFILANLGAGASIVFFNSFLSDITTEDMRDKVSSWGFAAGYLGGIATLIVGFLILYNAERFGLSRVEAERLCFLAAGIWWGGFSIFTLLLLKTRLPAREAPAGKSYLAIGISELTDTFRELFRLKRTFHFLLGYLLYNDGIQTVIAMSAVFLSQELFESRGIETDRIVLLIAFFLAQIFGFIGALLFERIANFTSTKTAILISLAIWSLIVIYAYGFLENTTEAYIMSAAIGLVLGGSQALSRSLFSQMIPKGRESAFFGLYAISERGTSWIGPLVFGLVAQLTNSYRPAILCLIAFFVIGSIILFFTNTKQAIIDAGNTAPENAA
ncbi:MAG: MFS transporter [Chloracidobacterium sp.]|nr:MFS transporter [Chloracidobacterium sp.]MCC6824382.1 MFS transporter [Acidobacteriota bacterium]MCO5332652.1 MFS transporter [Pyrinomonadaceae bacterium]